MSTVDDFLGVTPSWHVLAACRGMDPSLFFPERGASPREAKAVCETCPVRVDCLGQAFTSGERHGIWGGMSERQRRHTRKEARLPRRKTLLTHRSEVPSPAAIRQRAMRSRKAAQSTAPPDPASDSVEKILQILGYMEKRL